MQIIQDGMLITILFLNDAHHWPLIGLQIIYSHTIKTIKNEKDKMDWRCPVVVSSRM